MGSETQVLFCLCFNRFLFSEGKLMWKFFWITVYWKIPSSETLQYVPFSGEKLLFHSSMCNHGIQTISWCCPHLLYGVEPTNKVGEDPSNKRYPCIHCTCNGCTQECSFFGVCCYFKSEHSGNMDYLQAVVIFNCFRSSNLEKMPLLLPRYGWEGDGKFWDFSFWFLFFFLTFISLIFLTLPLQMKKRSGRNYIELFLFLCQT